MAVGGHDHRVDVLLLEQLAEIGVAPGVGKILLGGAEVVGVDVAQGDDPAEPFGVPGVAPAHPPAANQREADLLARRGRLGRPRRHRMASFEEPGGQGCGRRCSRALQKTAAGEGGASAYHGIDSLKRGEQRSLA